MARNRAHGARYQGVPGVLFRAHGAESCAWRTLRRRSGRFISCAWRGIVRMAHATRAFRAFYFVRIARNRAHGARNEGVPGVLFRAHRARYAAALRFLPP
ncbi:MAG: hypothetical protein A3H32_14725 [Betaproteobacteria bacterium RIFCSPLOWO2_02_FULL_63_19]|nr:MAG: hypothetical protein A3H32_14725 [Betaproteobacteria bacterium RIFCSPLOWO2_02_FULL_63_19]